MVVTVQLIPSAVAALELLMRSRGWHMTDAINQGAQIAACVEQVDLDNGRLYVRDAGSDILHRVRFL